MLKLKFYKNTSTLKSKCCLSKDRKKCIIKKYIAVDQGSLRESVKFLRRKEYVK